MDQNKTPFFTTLVAEYIFMSSLHLKTPWLTTKTTEKFAPTLFRVQTNAMWFRRFTDAPFKRLELEPIKILFSFLLLISF